MQMSEQQQQQPIHQVQCEDCKRWPINGWAYRCGQCRTTLCQACIMFTSHPTDHVFLLLKRPMDPRYASREQLLAVTPYSWVEPTPPSKPKSVIGVALSSKQATFNFGPSTGVTAPFSSSISIGGGDAPSLEHKKGPLFERASELARPPETQPSFSLGQQQQGDQMTIEQSARSSFSFGDMRQSQPSNPAGKLFGAGDS